MPMTFATKVVEQKGENKFVTGTGTAGQAGSSTVAYKPSLWKFDMGMTPVAGDMVTIKIPVAGNSSGVWLSVNNGTTYYPIAVSGDERLTTHYPNGYVITVIFETGFATKLYGNTSTGGAAGASLTSYTLDRWRIHNYYDSGNTNTNVTQTATTTNAAYEVLFSATADNTTRTEGARKTSTLTYNPSTKALSTGGTVNGYTLAGACAKAVDTTVTSGSANLPTSDAVASYVSNNSVNASVSGTTLVLS